MEEPSVLDFVKSKLAPWKYPPAEHNDSEEKTVPSSQPAPEQANAQVRHIVHWPWRPFLGLFFALLAQSILESKNVRNLYAINGGFAPLKLPIVLYGFAAVLLAWDAWRSLKQNGEWRLADPPAATVSLDPLSVRFPALIGGGGLALLVFLTSSNNLFTWINLGLLALAVACLVYAFWLPERSWRERLADWRSLPKRASLPAVFGVLIALGIAAYFRFAQLAQVPGEMNSDHAEKIMDVIRVLKGQTLIFFPNNGGREALQMYLVAGLVKFFGANLDFMALKTISALVGFLALPFYYLLGKEIANRRVGLLAMAFAGVAYWPNVVSRLGLRLPFYFLFTGMALYFLLRALRTSQRNDFILLGLALGISMYGYSADRALVLLVLLGVGLFIIHTHSVTLRRQTFWFTGLALILAGVVFLPMLRYLIDQPGAFLYRTLTRISPLEQPLSDPALLIFLRNTGRALSMFSWSNGEVWTVSVPYRPALDVASGALFWVGVVLVFVTYIRKRHWMHIFLLLSIPILMLPSIMSLAFPNENPNLYRTGGAAIPAFLLVGLALESLMTLLQKNFARHGSKIAWALAIFLFFISAYQSYNLVFNQYRQEYELSAWNTSELGQVVRDFSGTYGTVNNVWIMGYPYWVDTRLVGIISGYPLRDFALFAADIGQVPANPEAKLFLLNPQDQEAVRALQQRFSQGVLSTYPAKIPGKEFLLFFVPPQEG